MNIEFKYIMKLRIGFLLMFLTLWTIACVDEIELELENRENIVIIDGMIGDRLAEYQINVKYGAALGRSAEYVNEPVEGASVKVLDDTGEEYIFEERKPGEFHLWMQGIPGRSYHTEVILSEARSLPVILPFCAHRHPSTASRWKSTRKVS